MEKRGRGGKKMGAWAYRPGGTTEKGGNDVQKLFQGCYRRGWRERLPCLTGRQIAMVGDDTCNQNGVAGWAFRCVNMLGS